jgi:uroporphyrinogen decarboxylase
VIKPVHKRAIDWAHEKGAVTMLHSCGNITALLPDLVEIGLDGLNPLEVKAGMDALAIKEQFGDRLVLQGGIDVRTMSDPDAVEAEIRTKVPALKRDGGYIFHSDHSIPETVSFDDYRRVVALARKYGTYES